MLNGAVMRCATSCFGVSVLYDWRFVSNMIENPRLLRVTNSSISVRRKVAFTWVSLPCSRSEVYVSLIMDARGNCVLWEERHFGGDGVAFRGTEDSK